MEGVLEYENLVYSIVHKYGHKYDEEDLYQVGMIGLIQAKNNFNSDLDVKFSTYAYYYILGEITKYIRESKSLKLSKDIIRLNKSINKATDIMIQKLGRNPTTLELSLFLDIEEDKINEVLIATQDVQSLDYSYDDSNNMYNLISEKDTIKEELIDLKEELKRLNPEEKQLIRERYYEDLTQTEISKKTGISQVQISRKESKILEKLKKRL
ncbi:MAG: sigma-70 family RNA polymerase sigma factor [Bacilli bacterium]|nr:sigma-70 family RNA polymerase sigma factor [Bacilli bacterium]